MAVYNGLRWLPEQVESILQQQGVDLHLVISVDRSSDGSEAWCASLAADNPRVTLLPTGRRFGSASANFFYLLAQADLSDCDYIAFADQDDVWAAGKLCHAVRSLQQYHCHGYSGNVEAFWPDGRKVLIDKAQPQRRLDYLFEAAGPGCTYVLTRSLALGIQGAVRRHSEQLKQIGYHDWFCYAFARSQGYGWFIDPQSHMRYRQHADNSVGINSGLMPFLRRSRHVISGRAWRQTETLIKILFSDRPERIPIGLPVTRLDFIRFAFAAPECRRRRRDQVYFFCLCLLMSLAGRRTSPA